MDDEQTRRFWERALREIRDDGFFAPVQTAEPPVEPIPVSPGRRRLHLSNPQLVLIVLAASVIVTFLVLNWLLPVLF